MTTDEKTRYQVTSSMVQLAGPYSARSALSTGIETVFRQGDILPDWANAQDIERLASEGFIKAMPA